MSDNSHVLYATLKGLKLEISETQIPEGNFNSVKLILSKSLEWKDLLLCLNVLYSDNQSAQFEIQKDEVELSNVFTRSGLIQLGIVGMKQEGDIVKASNLVALNVTEGGYIVNAGVDASDYTLADRVFRAVQEANTARDEANEARRKALESEGLAAENADRSKSHAEEALGYMESAKSCADNASDSVQEVIRAKECAEEYKNIAEVAKNDAETARNIAINKATEAWGFSEEAYDYYAGISTMKREVEESLNEVLSVQSDVATKHKEVMEFRIETIPDYIKTEAKAVADNVVATRDAYSFVFGGISDLHTYGKDVSSAGVLHAGQGMNEINKRTSLDLVMNFGDVIADKLQGSYIEGFPYVRGCFDEVIKGVPYIQMQGNHDEYDSAYTEEEEKQKYFAHIGSNNIGTVTDWDNRFRNYGYRDFEDQKMRVIYLNSVDMTTIEKDGSCYISGEQFKWVVEKALNFSTKEDAENWAFIVCCHHPLNWEIWNTDNRMTMLLNVLDAYKGKSSGTLTADDITVNYDFTEVSAEFIAHFHGHLHNFRYEKLGANGVLTITIPNACFDRNNEYGTFENYSDAIHELYGDADENGNQRLFNKTADTAEDTAFNVVVVDRTNEVIHCFNYGAGIDREISYGGYTDIINVANVDYFDNTRLSTSATTIDTGTKTAAGYVTTKLIDVSSMGDKNNNVVIRTKGVDFSQTQSAFCSYLDDGTVYASNYISGSVSSGYAQLDDNGNLTLTINTLTLAKYCKFKICGYGLGENLVVTINEEI